jgi:hypothetical protein
MGIQERAITAMVTAVQTATMGMGTREITATATAMATMAMATTEITATGTMATAMATTVTAMEMGTGTEKNNA